MALPHNEDVITVYSSDKPEVAIPMDRKEFYKEQTALAKKKSGPTKAAAIIEKLWLILDLRLCYEVNSGFLPHVN